MEEKQPGVSNALPHHWRPRNPPPPLRLKTDVNINGWFGVFFRARIQLASQSWLTVEVKIKSI